MKSDLRFIKWLVFLSAFIFVCAFAYYKYHFHFSNLFDFGLGDLFVYKWQFDTFLYERKNLFLHDPGFYYLMLFFTDNFSFKGFLFFCFFVFYLSIVISVLKVCDFGLVSLLFIPVIFFYPFYISLSELVIRQGVAFAILFMFLFYFDSKITFLNFGKLLIAAAFHSSMVFYFLVFTLNFLLKKLKSKLFFWFFSLAIYCLNVPSMLLAGVGDSLGGFARALSLIAPEYETGFKFSFFIFSLLPLVVFISKRYRKYFSVTRSSKSLWEFYISSNAIALYFSAFPYYDRVMLFSWVITPFIFINFANFFLKELRSFK